MIILKINKQMLAQTIKWLIWISQNTLNLLIGRSVRFVVLTPPIFSRQLIFDFESKKIFSVFIRDIVDYLVIGEIFVYQDYSIKNLSRASDVFNIYQGILEIGKRPLIIDCGGNSGMATKYFCETYKDAVIICIEPDDENLLSAKLNNQNENVHFIQAGVANSDLTGNLIDPGRGSWGYQIEENSNGAIRLISIDTILKDPDFHNCGPLIIKVDIEGFENNLFEKNTDWIDLFPVMVIELHDWMLPKSANSQNFLKEVSKRNRDFILNRGNVFSVSNTII